MNGIEVKRFFAAFAPESLAYEWDNVGLQVGSLNQTLTGVLFALDVTKEVVAEAIEKQANVIVAHHPLIFKPLERINTDTYKGQLLRTLIRHDLALYVAHTNYDRAPAGMNDALSRRIGIKDPLVLDEADVEDAHGIGRIGDFEPMSLDEAVRHIKDRLGIEDARLITRKPNKTIKRVAVSGGSGAHHMYAAKFKGADLYVTGDIDYHEAHDIEQLGLTALDVGHYAERVFASALKEAFETHGFDVPLHVSEVATNPFRPV